MVEVFADYPIIDHLYRIENNSYNGDSLRELLELKNLCSNGIVKLWMSEITRVEMVLGLENPTINDDIKTIIEERDSEKIKIASELNVGWLTYPCSKTNDTYSRLNISLRTMGDQWHIANEMEKNLEVYEGISRGDARQFVSCIFGTNSEDLSYTPAVEWFITEDQKMLEALKKLKEDGIVTELERINIASTKEFITQI